MGEASGARLTARGAFNFCVVALGSPGSGKSTWILERAITIGAATPAVVIGYDPGYRVPSRSPHGAPYPVARHATLGALDAALRRESRRVHLLAAGEAGQLVEYGRSLAARSLAAHGGASGTPVLLLLDEAVLIDGAGTYRLGDEFRKLITGRRHENVGLLVTLQESGIAHKALLSLATELALFRVGDNATTTRLRACGVPADALATLPTRPLYAPYVHRVA